MSLVAPERRLLVTAGAGGVGKTTVAAALAVRAASEGRRVAVLTIDPARRLADALGLGALTGELRPVPASTFSASQIPLKGELWAMMLDTRTTSDQMVHRFAPDAAAAEAILKNNYYRYFSTSLSGTQEYMAVEQVRTLVDDPRFDLVVLDTPPAADALEFLDAPERLMNSLDSRFFQVMQSGKSSGLRSRLWGKGRDLIVRSLNTMTGGQFLDDLVEFFSVFGSILGALREASEAVQGILRDPSTRFLLITAPTRSNVEEALRFRTTLQARGLNFGQFIANRVHAPYTQIGNSDLPHLGAALSPLLPQTPSADREALLRSLLDGLHAHNRVAKRDLEVLTALNAVGEVARIPLMPRDIRDLGGLYQVARYLV